MTRDDVLDQLIRHEGTGPIRNGRLMPYKDSKGILSIGYGRNLQANGVRPSEARLMLVNDYGEAVTLADGAFPWYSSLDPVRQAVVSELVFNMGLTTVLEFVNTLEAISRHEFQRAAMGLRRSKWYQDVKEIRGERLATLLESGQW